MAVQRFKLPLNAATFPLLSTKAQRAVCVPQLDFAPRTPKTFFGSDDNIDYNVPQILYCENVMPVSEGIKSVAFRTVINPTVNKDFDSVFALRDENENTVLYSPSKGKNYVYDDVAGAWSSTPLATIWGKTLSAGSNPAASRVTYAYVDGKTFVCYSRLKSNEDTPTDMSIMLWNSTTEALTPATSVIANLPFGVGEIDGISSSAGYLLVWSGLQIAWAPFNGTEFNFINYANGEFTGAGSAVPEDIQGQITAIAGMSGGFIAFTTRNAIGANYHAQSIAAPFVFREIPDVGGLTDYEQVTVEGSLGRAVAYTGAGMQELTLNGSSLAHPSVSDFIAGRATEYYDFGSKSIIPSTQPVDLYTKISAIGNRYITVSYGYYPGVFSFALVYDLALKRWGKLRIVHRDCFYYIHKQKTVAATYSMLLDVGYSSLPDVSYANTVLPSSAVTSAQHAMAFLLETGEVKLAKWSSEEDVPESDPAVAIIGRVQLSRSSHVQFNTVEAEGLQSGSLDLMPSYDGRTLMDTVPLTPIVQAEDYLLAGAMIDCKNFNIIVSGSFELSTLVVEGTTSGKF